ncbi:TadE/TadG family type IV pilus assembly protein [Pseudomonas sp. NPDC090592]|uniref:TadE/TadG family type IV pilus assembly protein n=1 Tax=Pseudomonas sp. NPDC090592 TaxID=3364480 RepID=UPI00383AB697
MTFARSQRGSAAVETALILPIIIGIGLLGADLYTLHQARSYLEQSAHTIAATLAVQSKLDVNGLQALVDDATRMTARGNTSLDPVPYELIISKVEENRSLIWRPLHRGTASGVCTPNSTGAVFTGELPQVPRAAEDDGDTSASDSAAVVVQLCAHVDRLMLTTLALADRTLQVQAVSRLQQGTPTLDKALTQELVPQGQDN